MLIAKTNKQTNKQINKNTIHATLHSAMAAYTLCFYVSWNSVGVSREPEKRNWGKVSSGSP